MKPHLVLSGLILTMAGMVAGASGTNTVLLTPALITQLAEELRTNNPALLASLARAQAAEAGVAAVRTWDDPMLRAGAMAADKPMRADDGDLIYGVEQKLPLFGKPALARRQARAELLVEQANADFQFQTLRSELAQAVFQTALAEKVVAVAEQDLRWLETVVETTEGRYQAGQDRLGNVLQLQNERAKRSEQLQTERANLGHAQLTLNRFLNRNLDSPWPALELPEIAGPVVYSPKLVDLAVQYEPRLRMMQQQIAAAQAAVATTRRDRLPEVALGAVSRSYSGNGDFRQAEFMLSFSLPWFNAGKYRSAIRRDEARLKATEFDAADQVLSLRQEIHLLTVRIDAARREALAYRDQIIPRSEQALASTQAMWESGGGTLRDLLEARRLLLDARLMHARAVAEQYRMLSELVLCCGLGDLEALQMVGIAPDHQKPETKP